MGKGNCSEDTTEGASSQDQGKSGQIWRTEDEMKHGGIRNVDAQVGESDLRGR